MKKLLTLVSCALITLNSTAQTPSTSIATWKNDAKGAYSFIHDDYGDPSVAGINNYADTIARNRGIKFTIGAITSSCEANPQMWTDAIDMINYGHEIINHTHNHYCAVRADDWCNTGLWAEPNTEDFATEMTQSSNSITSNTGTTPRFFIYPYDLYNDAANDHLKSLNYIGSRTGDRAESSANFTPDSDGFFKTNFYVKTLDNNGDITAGNLNYWADQASANNAWINREMHNVGPTGWGHITVDNYRDHLNHLQTEVTANNLWVGTISEVLTYQIQKLNYTPNTSYDVGLNEITVSWNIPSFDVPGYLAPLTKKNSVTILVNLDGIDPAGLIVKQGINTISDVTVRNGVMKFDAYPSEGTITIGSGICTDFCFVSGLSNTTVNVDDNTAFNINITATPTVTYQWYFNDVLIVGKKANSLALSIVQTNQAGTYKVVASKPGETDITDSAVLTVDNQTPFNNTIAA
ncbi:MAG: peptidoglycan/xylan/chitin deacetylase (PgdA/CDA1 family), partial [Glaciecola sp.]